MTLTWENLDCNISFKISIKGKDIPTSQWASVGDKKDKSGIAILFGLVDNDYAQDNETQITVPNEIIARLTSNEASALTLPPPVPFILDISHSSTLDQSEFKFQYRWLKQGRPIVRPTRNGVFLKAGSQHYRLLEPNFSIVDEIDRFNQDEVGSLDDRFQAWARIREKYLDNQETDINFDQYLSGTKVGLATQFTLQVNKQNGEFQFDPVLVANIEKYKGTDSIIETDTNLLPPHYQEVFAKRFKDFEHTQARYALEKGWYVFIDPTLFKTFEIVKKYQISDESTRRAFFKNPQSFIERELNDTFDDQSINQIFVETEAYSERVLGEGLWEPKVIPWIRQKNNDPWLPPEQLGILVGHKRIEINPGDVEKIIKDAKKALAKDEKTFKYKGKEIPATQETISILESIPGLATPKKPPKPEKPLQEKWKPSVLLIDDNFESTGFIAQTRPHRTNGNPLPANLTSTLKPHQQTGLMWLQKHWLSGSPGALLADDMGLGKTLQCLTFLAWLREEMDAGMAPKAPLLVIAPTGLLENWKRENNIHFTAPGVGAPLLAYAKELKNIRLATADTAHELQDAVPRLDTRKLKKATWILTTYETLRNYQHSFCSIKYTAAVFDEAQKIKTPGTVMTEAAKAVNAEFMLTMTGTPIENRLADLWCIIDTSQPGRLQDLKSFSKHYEKSRDKDTLKTKLKELKDSLMPIGEDTKLATILRRNKSENLDGLPQKIERIIERAMPTVQAAEYSKIIEESRNSEDQGSMLATLHALRNVSLHPTRRTEESDEEYIALSARTQLLMDILDNVQSKNEKALLFLESRELQETIGLIIQSRYKLKERPLVINGAVSGPKRQQRVNTFQERAGFEVMILSPRAGGVGLTLTAANHIIHLSRWWNPAVEDQCSDRAYRIGQDKDVYIYYPQAVHPNYSEHSYDLRLHTLLNNKRELSREFLVPTSMDDSDITDFYRQTVQPKNSSGSVEEEQRLLLQIDSMEPLQFEEWSLNQLQRIGYSVKKTPRSHDCGADGIAYPKENNQCPIIIQCKHTQNPSKPSRGAVSDLARAIDSYHDGKVQLFAITNSEKFSDKDTKESQEIGAHLVTRNMLSGWPNNVL